MELFSEVYSCYFNIISKILNMAQDKAINKKDIHQIVECYGFKESSLYIMPKLLKNEWRLLKGNESDNSYSSKLNYKTKLPITKLQEAWLAAIIQDKRIRLFIEDEELDKLKDKLINTEPLFSPNDFIYFDQFTDGDAFDDENYIQAFRQVLSAVKEKRILSITYESGNNKRITGYFIPYRIEYSNKDDKFRAFTLKFRSNSKKPTSESGISSIEKRIISRDIINISRITGISNTEELFDGDLNKYIKRYEESNFTENPVIIEISNERNAVERCMLHFASYKKNTEYDEKKGKYICYIYYNKLEETELLIRILSFGPVIRVLGPEQFLQQVKARVKRQNELFS